MEIRDPVHGSIRIPAHVVPIITDRFFSRLRGIKQLGFSEYVFPGATHTRFLHSVGVFGVATRALLRLDRSLNFPHEDSEWLRLKETFKLAALCHDIGHAPLSHATEIVMPAVKKLKLPTRFDTLEERLATHEDYTIKAVADSEFREAFKRAEKEFGVSVDSVADLICGRETDLTYFSYRGKNYFPLFHQLVSSELDCDRMDYLLRDSYFCGVSYGTFDLDWLLDNLIPWTQDNTVYLGISERAVVTFDDFLLCRFHMFTMVYFHYRAVCLEKLLLKFFISAKGEYFIPEDIAAYTEHDDHYLMRALRHSKNIYAKSILENRIPQKIFESFNAKDLHTLEKAQEYLESIGADYINCSSERRLSKYYELEKSENISYPLYVIRQKTHARPQQIMSARPIDQATDLFYRFKRTHSINRLHCDLNALTAAEKDTLYAHLEGPLE